MPKPEEWCEVRTNNGVFRNWTSVAVHYGADPNFERTVTLECAEPMKPGRSGVALVAQRLKPGDRVDVALGGQLVIENGYIKVRQTAYDAQRHAVQVVAVSAANTIREVSVDVVSDSGQFRNYTFEAIANKVLKPVGVGLRLVNPPAAATLPFRQVIAQTGETIGEFIERLARQRGLWLWADVDGTILAGDPTGSSGATLEEGVNILKASSYVELPAVDKLIWNSQTSGSNDLWAGAAAHISAQTRIPGGVAGALRIGLAEHADTQQDLQARTNHEAANIASAIHRDIFWHQGWFRPGTNKLWNYGDFCVVKSPMLYPFDGGQQTLQVWGITCSQSDQEGTITQVELVNQATYQNRYPDASSSTPATPQ
jgi:prophage tail gpP-like protein